MNIGTALLQGQQILGEISAPRLTAEVLLAHAIGCNRTWLYAHSDEELREVWWIHYGRYLHERLAGKPTQYITGRQEFFGREFRVTTDVLIPRPETEHVVEQALQRSTGARRIADIGTGSGAIAVTLALERKAAVIATDVSQAALRVAAINSERLGATVGFVACDLGSALATGAFDMIVSNPPYIAENNAASLPREVREHEPSLALFGGEDGLAVYRRLIPEAMRLLRPGGWLVMEIGDRSMAALLDVEIVNDLAGLPRVALARRPA